MGPQSTGVRVPEPLDTDEAPEPVEAPEPRHDLHEDLLFRLDEEEERALTTRILTDNIAALEDRTEWETRLAEWEDQYYGRMPEKNFPWPGCSNFSVRLAMTGVEAYKPRLVDSVLGQTPPVIVVPTESTDEDRRDRVELFLNWQILSKLDLAPVVTQSAHLFLQPGLSVAKVYWKVSRLRRRFVREFPPTSSIETILEAVFGGQKPKEMKKTGDLTWEGTMPSSNHGDPLIVKLRLKFLDKDEGLQVLIEQEELLELPHVDLLDPIDAISPANGGAEVRDLPWFQHRLWLYEEDLREKVLLGRFYADAVQALLDQVTLPTGDAQKTDSAAYKSGQAQTEGVAEHGASDARQDQFEVLEDYRRYDIDGDGVLEEIITWVSPQLPQKILGWDYLDNVYAHGRRPFHVGRFFPIPFRFLGLPFTEIVRDLEDEINAIHNQRMDYGTITNLPFYFYRASALNPPTQTQLVPGQGVPVDNPKQDIEFPRWNSSPAWGQGEEAILLQYYERRTGVSDLSLGRQPNRVGATRTMGGTQALLDQGNLRFKTAVETFQRFWIGIFSDILALDQEYLPPGVEYRVTGKQPEFVRLKDRTDIRGQYDIRLAATSETVNRGQMRQDSVMIMQALRDPALLQSGMVGIKGIQRSTSDFLKAFGKDPDYYLEHQSPVREPNEELAMFVSGVYVSPSQGENVAQHLTTHQAQLLDPELAPYLKPDVRDKLKKHIQETEQLQRGAAMAQALQAQAGPRGAPAQAGNAAIGAGAPQMTPPPPTTTLPPPGAF